ncbi:unnamed protein product [Parnassius apollo]|uniref:(apollo) hypothetical protein n=1 Tax=Parnassius apollo TaxID=110799 RepID=A0A8S3WN64_PARAO|nr:unnamed protein product [Parnassius apollo]
MSAGSSRAQQSAPATGGARRMRWTTQMNSNALRAYFRAEGGEIGGFAYWARMHRLFAELEPSVTVTEQNLANRVRYILRSNTFDVTELERIRREAVLSSDENATAEDAAPQFAEQPANVDAAANPPVLVDSNDDGTVAQELELEQMRSTLDEAILETRSTPLENRPRLPRIALSKRNRAIVRALNPIMEPAAPVEEPQEDQKSAGRAETNEYRPGQVFSLNAQELLDLQPERQAPVASNQQLQQLYDNPQPEHKQNLQPLYYYDPQLAGQMSLQPSHAVIARPDYSSNGGEASVGAALSVSDTGNTPSHSFDQELLTLLGHSARQEDQRLQAYTQTQQPLQVLPQNIGQQYQQIENYLSKPGKKPTNLRSNVPTESSTAPQQYLIETTNVQPQQQPLQNQFHFAQPQRAPQTLRYIPIQPAQPDLQQTLYDRPESQGLKIVPAPNLQNLQPLAQNNYPFIPQYLQPELVPNQYRFVDTQGQQIQAISQEQPQIVIGNIERPLTYLKRIPEHEKVRTVKIYNQAGSEGLTLASQPVQIGEQFYLRPLHRSNDQRGRYELSPQALKSVEQARAIGSTKAPLSTIYVNKKISPKKVVRPSQKSEQSARGQFFRIEQKSKRLEQISADQQSKAFDEQRARLPPPRNNKAYTPEEFAALVAAGYSVTPVPVGSTEQQAQSRSFLESIQIPQRRPLYSKRHQYLPLRYDEAP